MDPLTYQTLIAGSSIRTKIFNTPGTYSWTAPAGVNRIISLIGRGGSGVTLSFSQTNPSYYFSLIDGFTKGTDSLTMTLLGPNITYEEMRNRINSDLLPQWQAITTNSTGSIYYLIFDQYYYINSNWYLRNLGPHRNYPVRYRRIGTVSAIGSGSYDGVPDVMNGTGNIPTSNIYGGYTLALGAYASNIEIELETGYPDTNSTAFGYQFTGQQTSINPAQTAIFTNIPITPGTTYSIVVGQNYDSPTSFVELRY